MGKDNYFEEESVRTYTDLEMKVSFDRRGKAVIERKLNGKEHRYIGSLSKNESFQELLKPLKIDSSIPYNIWVRVGDEDDDKVQLYLEKGSEEPIQVTVTEDIFGSFQLVPDSQHFIASQETEINQLFAPITKEPFLRAKDEKIEKVKAGALTFSMKPAGRLSCDNYPGYVVSGNQKPEFLSAVENALVLEDRSGNLKVLVSANKEYGLTEEKDYLVEIDFPAGKAPTSNSFLGKLLISSCYIQNGDFAEGFSTMPQSDHAYTKEEIIALDKLAQKYLSSIATEQRVYGLKLYSLLVGKAGTAGIELKELEDLTLLLFCYQMYLQEGRNLQEIGLSQVEETSLLRYLVDALAEKKPEDLGGWYKSDRTWQQYADSWNSWFEQKAEEINPMSFSNYLERLEERLEILETQSIPEGSFLPFNIPSVKSATGGGGGMRDLMAVALPKASTKIQIMDSTLDRFSELGDLLKDVKEEEFSKDLPKGGIWHEIELPKDFWRLYHVIQTGDKVGIEKIRGFFLQKNLREASELPWVDLLEDLMTPWGAKTGLPTVESLKKKHADFIEKKETFKRHLSEYAKEGSWGMPQATSESLKDARESHKFDLERSKDRKKEDYSNAKEALSKKVAEEGVTVSVRSHGAIMSKAASLSPVILPSIGVQEIRNFLQEKGLLENKHFKGILENPSLSIGQEFQTAYNEYNQELKNSADKKNAEVYKERAVECDRVVKVFNRKDGGDFKAWVLQNILISFGTYNEENFTETLAVYLENPTKLETELALLNQKLKDSADGKNIEACEEREQECQKALKAFNKGDMKSPNFARLKAFMDRESQQGLDIWAGVFKKPASEVRQALEKAYEEYNLDKKNQDLLIENTRFKAIEAPTAFDEIEHDHQVQDCEYQYALRKNQCREALRQFDLDNQKSDSTKRLRVLMNNVLKAEEALAILPLEQKASSKEKLYRLAKESNKQCKASEKLYAKDMKVLVEKKQEGVSGAQVKTTIAVVSSLGKKLGSIKGKEAVRSIMRQRITAKTQLTPLTYEEASKAGKNLPQVAVDWEGLQAADAGALADIPGKLAKAEKELYSLMNYMEGESPYSKGPIEEDQLKALVGRGTLACFKEYTGWSANKASLVSKAYCKVLVYKTRKTRLEKLEQVKQEEKKQFEERGYELNFENRFMLLLEAGGGFVIRKEQGDKIGAVQGAIDEGSSILAEMRTGFGKTAVVMRVALKKMAEAKEKKALSVCICPGSLIGPNYADTQEGSKQAYGSRTDFLAFSREMSLTPHGLENIHHKLLDNIQNDVPVFITPESAKSLGNHFIFAHGQLEKNPESEALQRTAAALGKILLIFSKARAFVDEGDKLGKPGPVVQWPLSSKKYLSAQEGHQICHLFRGLDKGTMDIIQNGDPSYFTEDQKKKIKADLITSAMKALPIPKTDREKFAAFIDDGEGNFSEYASATHFLYKGLIQSLIPSALAGKVGEHYGFSLKHREGGGRRDPLQYVIPYENGEPKETDSTPSQLSNPHETLVKTLIAYTKEGISKKNALDLLENLKRGIENKEAGVRELIGNLLPESFHIEKASDEQLDFLAEAIAQKGDLNVIHTFVERVVAPTIVMYPESLSADAHNMLAMFGSAVLVTATPQEAGAVSSNTTPFLDPEVQENFLNLLTSKGAPEEGKGVAIATQVTAKAALQESIDLAVNSKARATVDEGGFWNGVSEKEMVQGFDAKLGQEITEIVYFNKKENNFMVYDRGTKGEVLYDPLARTSAGRFVIYDQARSVGSDIKMPDTSDSLFILNISNTSTLTSVQQGAGRARALASNQTLKIVAPEALKKQILKGEKRDLKIDDVVTFLKTQEQEARAHYEFAARKQQMTNVVRSYAMTQLLNAKDPQLLYKKYKSILIETSTSDPRVLYAASKEMTMEDALKEHQKICDSMVDNLYVISKKDKSKLKEDIAKSAGKLTTNLLVRASSVKEGGSMEVSQDQSQEQSTQADINVDLTQSLPAYDKRKEAIWDRNLDVKGSDAWLKTTKLSVPLHTRIYRGMGLNKLEEKSKELKETSRVYRAITSGCSTIASVFTYIPRKLFQLGGKIASLIGPDKTKETPQIFSVKEAMHQAFPGKEHEIFSENLFVTSNFWDIQNKRAKGTSVSAEKPCSDHQKSIHSVLITQTKEQQGTKKFSVVMIDDTEAAYFRDKINKSKKGAPIQVAMGVYHLGQRSLVKDDDLEDVVQEDDFEECIAQVKLLQGRAGLLSEGETSKVSKTAKQIQQLALLQPRFAQASLKNNPILSSKTED